LSQFSTGGALSERLAVVVIHWSMSPLMRRSYRCPNTGLPAQSFACIKSADGAYEVVTCNICRGVHFIDLATGKLLREDKEAEAVTARPRLRVAARNS
jgi:hypothetical protein